MNYTDRCVTPVLAQVVTYTLLCPLLSLCLAYLQYTGLWNRCHKVAKFKTSSLFVIYANLYYIIPMTICKQALDELQKKH